MQNVHVLPPEVVAKIAAGEVIERPSSVVKELIENSLDAKATHVEVHLKDAGKDWIHIKDNGTGIAHEDLETIFLRHATSKIKQADDLHNLFSLGFRGEALYSVAAVADIQLKSKIKSNASTDAWQIHYRGGEKLSLEPTAMANHGTEIKISELFFNTPARKKFLKSSTSEMNQIVGIFTPYTLLYPHVRFLLTHNGKTIVDAPAAKTLTERAARVCNVDEQHLIEVEHSIDGDTIGLKMVLGNINIQRPRKNMQYLFINDRPVFNQNLKFHFNDVYRLIFPPGVYPFFSAYIDLPPEDVDANMHPTKREVKIRQESRVISLIRRSVEDALMTKGDIRTVSAEQASDSRQQASEKPTSEGIPTDQILFAPRQTSRLKFSSNRHPEDASASEGSLFDETLRFAQGDDNGSQGDTNTLQSKFQRARYIGQFMNKYLLWEVDDALLCVDQHAAQERIMYERIRHQMNSGDVEVQHLLAPILLKLSPQEKVSWENSQEKFKKVGFEATQFDDDTIALQTHPVLIKKPERAARALLAGDDVARCDEDTLARRACRSSIMTGDKLAPEQAEHQRTELLECQDPFTCPHGRPTVIEIKDSFLERQFLRT